MDTLKYIVKRLLLAVVILLGVSVIIYGLSRMMPSDYVDQQYASSVNNGTIKQEEVDRIKELYGLYMPDAYLSMEIQEEEHGYSGKSFTKNTKESVYEEVQYYLENGSTSKRDEWYVGAYDCGEYRVELLAADDESVPFGYYLYEVHELGWSTVETEGDESSGSDSAGDNTIIRLDEELVEIESGTYVINEDGTVTVTATVKRVVDSDGNVITESKTHSFTLNATYRVASGWDKAGTVLGGYFSWLGNLMKGDLGVSFKYKQPVGEVIMQNMGTSFAIAFVATILQFLIAIPLGIKAATRQYGVVDYTVTVLTMIGISLPTFFLGALMIRVFSVQLGIFPVGGLSSPNLPVGVSWFTWFGDVLWHMVLPMFVLVILSVGSLMRYTRTNTLEVLNADYIRTARAKGLSEKSVIYKHAFRNTMIPLVTLMASILPSLFGGAMITETVFAIPGIGKLAYDALLVADVPFIMGYNMFLAIMTVLGTLLSDIMYAVVDPRVKLGK